MSSTILKIHSPGNLNKNLDYSRNNVFETTRYKYTSIILFTIFSLFISFIVSILQFFDYKPLIELNRFKRIKNNMSSWKSNIISKSGIDSQRGKLVALQLNNKEIHDFSCYDFGNYYVSMRLNSGNYLPEFIRRGDGDVWRMLKSSKVDESSKQFCQYVTINNKNNTLTCGINMYEELGYGGYFNKDHPCQTALDIIQKTYVKDN